MSILPVIWASLSAPPCEGGDCQYATRPDGVQLPRFKNPRLPLCPTCAEAPPVTSESG